MSKKTKISLIVIIVLFIAGMALYPTIKQHLSQQEDPPAGQTAQSKNSGGAGKALNVMATVIKPTNLTDVFRTKGILIPNEEVSLSFEASGKITDIYFQEGTTIKKGQLLAKVNDLPLQAELKKLLAQKPLAEDRVYRQKSLLERDAVSKESYESINTELEKLYADIELVKSKIAQTELRAPFDGVIGLRQVSEGAYATPTTIISNLTSISPLKIEFSVNERQARDIKEGTKLNFVLENDLNVYNATVYAVESKLDEKTLSLKARALYPNPQGKLRPGHSAGIEIKLKEIQETIAIPSIASITEMGRDLVYIFKGGKAKQIVITKGLRTASSVQVLDGLQTGDTLLVSGVMQLREGLPVVVDQLVDNVQ